jgi:hypothetical protein
MTDDLFDDVEPAPRGLVTAGRYRLPNRDGSHHPGGWMRASNLAAALSDQKALRDWEVQMVLLGVRTRPDLVDELAVMDPAGMEPAVRRKELLQLAEDAKRAAKADEGARRGNARHTMVHRFHAAGVETGTPAMREQLRSYREVLEAHRLTPIPGMQERVVIVEALDCAGRLDTILWDEIGSTYRIGDLKTQRAFWSLMEVRAQLAIYAHADAMWDESAGRYVDMPPVHRELGHVMWMPKDRPEDWPEEHGHDVRILDIDLVKGWSTAQRAYEICRDRSEAKSVATLTGMFRPLPAGAVVTMRSVEDYARRFAECESWRDGSRLYEQARADGLWGPELERAAQAAAARLRAQSA